MEYYKIFGYIGAISVLIAIVLFFIPSEKIPKSTKACILVIGVILVGLAIREDVRNQSPTSTSTIAPSQMLVSTTITGVMSTPTLTPTPTSTPMSIQTQTSVSQSTDIPFITPGYSRKLGWDTRETKELYPMFVVVGDVEIEGKKYYDVSGAGECTIATNFSLDTVTVYAQWGAGEYALSYNNDYAQLQLENIIQDEFDTDNHPSRIRLVTIDEYGQITQKYIYNSD